MSFCRFPLIKHNGGVDIQHTTRNVSAIKRRILVDKLENGSLGKCSTAVTWWGGCASQQLEPEGGGGGGRAQLDPLFILAERNEKLNTPTQTKAQDKFTFAAALFQVLYS